MLEYFKAYFATAAGISGDRSSSENWAETDLWPLMERAAVNAPLFIEAFYDACEALRGRDLAAPDAAMINGVLSKHGVGFSIEPPHLKPVGREGTEVVIEVPERPPTLAERAVEVLQIGRAHV